MAAQVIIKLIPDTSAMPAAEDAIEELAGVDKATADQIRNTNKAFQERAQATEKASSSTDKLAKASKSLTESIAGGAINQAASNIDKLSKKFQEGGKGVDTFKASIEAAKQALATMSAGTAEFDNLSNEIKAATASFDALNGIVASTPTERLQQLEAVLDGLKQSGLEGTQTFKQLQTEAEGIANAINNASDEYKAYAAAIEAAKQKLSSLSQEDPEFDRISKETQAAEIAMGNFSKEATSSRGKLRQFRETLLQLEEAGLDGTQVFEDLAMAAGELEDQVGDTQARIKVLASDTFKFDVGIQAIQGVTAAFGVAQGAAALFGSENEDVQKALLKVNAAMSILQGLQSIQNLLQKQSALYIGASVALQKLQVLQTNLQAAAESRNIVVRYAAIAAQKALNFVMSTNPAGAVLFAISALATGLYALTRNTEDAAEAQKKLNDGLEISIDLANTYSKAIGDAGDILVAQLEAQGASEADIRAQRIKTLKNQLAEQERVYRSAQNNYNAILESGTAKTKSESEEQAKERQRAYDLVNDSASKFFDTQKQLELAELNNIKETNKEKADAQKKAEDEAKKAREEGLKNHQAILRDQVAAAEVQLLNARNNFDKLTAQIVLANAKLKQALANPDLGPNERVLAEAQAGEEIRRARQELFGDLEKIDTNRSGKITKALNEEVLTRAKAASERLATEQNTANNSIKVTEAELARKKELREQYEQLAIDSAVQLAGIVAQAALDSTRAQADAELAILQEKLDQQLISEKEFDHQQRIIKRRQAQQEKELAIFQAFINAAAAVTKVFASTAPPASFVLAGITAALAAAQIAAIATKPIPAFKKGTKNAPGGPSLIGEAGPELYYADGRWGYAAGPTILDLPKGAKVVPTLETEKILQRYDIPMPKVPAHMQEMNGLRLDYSKLAKYVGREVGREIEKMPVNVFGYDADGPWRHTTTMQNRHKYLDKKFGRRRR